jgi:hypothetical protein
MTPLSLFPMTLPTSNRISSSRKEMREMMTLMMLIWSHDLISQIPHAMINFRETLTTCSKNITFTMISRLFPKRMKIISVRLWTCPLQSMALTPISSQTSKKSNRYLHNSASIVPPNRNKRILSKMNQHFN